MKWEVSPELRELVERAELAHQRFYVGELKNRLEQTAWGKYVAIHIDTGEYLVADSQDVLDLTPISLGVAPPGTSSFESDRTHAAADRRRPPRQARVRRKRPALHCEP